MGPADSGNGQFNHPRSMAIDEDKLQFVTNIGNYKIEKFDMNRNFIVTIKIWWRKIVCKMQTQLFPFSEFSPMYFLPLLSHIHIPFLNSFSLSSSSFL